MKFDLTLHEINQNSYHHAYNNRFRNFKIIIRICETHLYNVNIIKQTSANNYTRKINKRIFIIDF